MGALYTVYFDQELSEQALILLISVVVSWIVVCSTLSLFNSANSAGFTDMKLCINTGLFY